MKKFLTFFAAVLMAGSMMASNITYHLTGCTCREDNPTEFTGDEDLYFVREKGYTFADWEVTVKYGETVLAHNDFGNDYGYVQVSAGYLNVVWYGKVTEDVDVTIVCQTAAPIELGTIALEAYEEGIHVTTSVPNMEWFFDIKPVSQVADSTAMDAILAEAMASHNENFHSAAYAMSQLLNGYKCSTAIGKNILFSEYNVAPLLPESGDYYCFALGIVDDDGFVARGTHLAILQFTYEAPATINYWLVGTVAENEWDEKKATPMEDDAIVCHLAAGEYEFKVLSKEASWEGALGYDNVDLEASSDNVYAAGAFGNIGFELEEEGDVTIAVVEGKIVVTGDFKKAEETVSLFGSFNGWGGQDMVVAEDGLTASLTLSLAADTKYEFKVVLNGGTWLTNSGTMTRENCTDWTFEATGENCGIQTDVEGDYIFVYTIADSKLSVTYPTISAVENAAAEMKTAKIVENGQMIIIRDGKKFNVVGAEL